MSTTEQTAAPAENSTTDKTNEVHDNGVDKDTTDGETPSKVAKLDENDTGKSVKRRSSGRQKKSADIMLAEAKAVCGEIDTSAGRSMRKRPDPPKVEEKKKPVQRTRSKKGEKPEAKAKAEENEDEADEAKEEETKSEDKPNDTAEATKTEESTTAATADETDSKPAEKVEEKNGTKEESEGAGDAANGSSEVKTSAVVESAAANNGDSSSVPAAATAE